MTIVASSPAWREADWSHQASAEKSELQISQEGLNSSWALPGRELQGCDRCDINQLGSACGDVLLLTWDRQPQSPWVVTRQPSHLGVAVATQILQTDALCGEICRWDWNALEEKGRHQNTGTSFLFQHPLAEGPHSYSSQHLRGAVLQGLLKSPPAAFQTQQTQTETPTSLPKPPCLMQWVCWSVQCFLLSHFTLLLPRAPFPSLPGEGCSRHGLNFPDFLATAGL